MKTSILISTFAALCLLVTFAEAPHRHGEVKLNTTLTDNISIVSIERVTVLPGVVITAEKKEENRIIVPIPPAGDFSFQKFDVADYMKTDAIIPMDAEIFPEVAQTDYGYLKFELSDYFTTSALTGDEITELPVNEYDAASVTAPEPTVNEFEYLRFDVNFYINNSGEETAGIGELPIDEAKTADLAQQTVLAETITEFGYLKFDVTKFYDADRLNSEDGFPLPVE